jgi:hypothetical protein
MAIELTYKTFLDLYYNPQRQASRAKVFRDWFGPNWADLTFQKAIMVSTDTNVQNINYGAPVQDWMNFETNVFSILPKQPWGPKSGFRFVDRTASRASGIQETATLPGASNATYGQISYDVKYHSVAFKSTEKARFYGGIDDNIDRWAVEREKWGKILGRSIDEFLTRPIYARQDYNGTGTGGATTVTMATYVIETLQRMVSSASEATTLVSAGGISGATSADVYAYSTGNRLRRSGYASSGPWDAVVDHNTFTLRSLTLKRIEDNLDQVVLNGASKENLILLTGIDTARAINRMIEAKQRFEAPTRVLKTLNGVQRMSETGVDAGFEVLSYEGVPIFTSRGLYEHRNARRTGSLTDIFGLHLPDIYISVARPVTYVETSDWLLQDKMQSKAAYFFAAELVFRRFNTHFKLTDIQP